MDIKLFNFFKEVLSLKKRTLTSALSQNTLNKAASLESNHLLDNVVAILASPLGIRHLIF